MNDRIKIKGYVNVYQHEGDFSEEKRNEENKIFSKCSNKFVGAMLLSLQGWMSIESLHYNAHIGTDHWKMVLGTDTGTPTTVGMTALTLPIGTGDGTAPDTKSGSSTTEVSTGNWEARYISTWYSGSVTGTVGEIGLYLDTIETGFSFGETEVLLGDENLTNRLSVADGEFSSFTIDSSKSMTVEWVVRYEFE